ncbi:hypothetical protein TB2_040588 [Malus domestica]
MHHRHLGSSFGHFPLLSENDFLMQLRIILLDASACPPIALGIPRHGHVLLNAIFLEELRQIFAYELRAIVYDNGLKNAKSENDVPPYEAFYVCLSYGCHGLCLHLFGKIVSYHDQHASTPSNGRHWPYQVDCPLHEWPRTRLRVQFTGRQCWYQLVVLAAFALLY